MKKIFNYIKRNKYYILFIILICIVGLGFRIPHLNFISDDMSYYLLNWTNQITENGGMHALSKQIGNYNLPYLTILAIFTYLPFSTVFKIKILSIIFDYILAFSILWLTYLISKDNKKRKLLSVIAFATTLLLPTIFLNSSLWGQADSIYTAFIVLSICFLIKEKNFWSFVMLGISFAFKLQAIFVLPLYIIYYATHEKYKWYYFLIIPLMDVILCIPALIYGAPPTSIVGIYASQTVEYSKYLSMNLPNIYFLNSIDRPGNLVEANNNIDVIMSILFTGLMFFILLILTYMEKNKVLKNKNFIIETAILSITLCTFFLPCMHERYIYPLILLLIPYIIVISNKKSLLIFMETIAFYTYINFLCEYSLSKFMWFYSYVFLSVVIAITMIYYKNNIKTDED